MYGVSRQKTLFFILSAFIIFGALSSWILPQARADVLQKFSRRLSIGRLQGALIIVGYAGDSQQINQLLDQVIQDARRTYDLLDADNPNGEVAKLNANAGGKQGLKVSWQVMEAFKSAQSISRWTKGVFDIVEANGNYKRIGIDDDESTIWLKNNGMRVNFAPIIEGYLADYIIKLVYTAGMRNALVKVGGVFRGVGQAPNGPWMIEVQENFATAVQHALKLTVVNTGIASISSQQHWERKIWDYRSKTKGKPKCKGVVIVMNEAAFAQGVAHAVYTLGPQEGIKFLDKFGKARGLIVDAQGQFLRKGM